MSDALYVPSGEGILLDVERKKERYVCPKGHTEEATRPFTVSRTEEPEAEQVAHPVCRFCYVQWIRETFPASKVENT